MNGPKIFLCHTSKDSDFVIQVASHLKTSIEEVFYYEDCDRKRDNFVADMENALANCTSFVVFVGDELTDWQIKEMNSIKKRRDKPKAHVIFIKQPQNIQDKFIKIHNLIDFDPVIPVKMLNPETEANDTAQKILRNLEVPWRGKDDLPLNPHLFFLRKGHHCLFQGKGPPGGYPLH